MGIGAIRYVNWIMQVCRVDHHPSQARQPSRLATPSICSRLSSLRVSCFPWGTNLERASPDLGDVPTLTWVPSIKWKYRVLAGLFGVIMLYLLGSAIVCILQASKKGGNIYRVMLFSLIITYGSWTASSLLAFDPWHLISSMFQYLLLAPFYINLLNMCVLRSQSKRPNYPSDHHFFF